MKLQFIFLFCLNYGVLLSAQNTDTSVTTLLKYKTWVRGGNNLQFVFGQYFGSKSEAKPDFSAFVSMGVDIPLGSRFLLFSPEAYYLGKGDYVPYLMDQGQPVYGILNLSGIGIACPVGFNLTNQRGTGIRLSGGVFGEFNYSPDFKDAQNESSTLEFYKYHDQFDVGAISSFHVIYRSRFDLRLSYMYGFQPKTYISRDIENPVKGTWVAWHRYFVLSFGASF